MQVFDHDYGSADDFMGAASVNLDKFADGQYVHVYMCVCVCVLCVYNCVMDFCMLWVLINYFLPLFVRVHMRDVGLSDPSCPHENLGYIRLFIKIDCNDSKLTTKTVSFT